jgi:hypothetical protein
MHSAEPMLKLLRDQIDHRNPTTSYLAMALLEFLVKNCTHMHAHVARVEFLEFMIEIAVPVRSLPLGFCSWRC